LFNQFDLGVTGTGASLISGASWTGVELLAADAALALDAPDAADALEAPDAAEAVDAPDAA
jgi:hypothetical protein